MKLTELSAFRGGDPNEKFSDVVKAFVEKHGTKKFEGNNAVVIDRGTFVWRAWLKDPGYERFLKYVQANPSNHLPKLLSRVRTENIKFKGMPNGMTIKFVKLEKLESISTNQEQLVDEIGEIADLGASDDFYHAVHDLEERLGPGNDGFVLLVISLVQHHDANDIGSKDNIMRRGTVLVVSDPFSD